MTTLPERLQDFADFFPVTCGLDREAVALLREAATALQPSVGGVVETMINHTRDPHCIGCYVIRWNDGAPVAECNECRATVALLDGLASPAQADGWVRVPDHYDANIAYAACVLEQSTCAIDRLNAPPLRKLVSLMRKKPNLTAAPSAPRAGDTAQDSGQGERLN